MPVVPTAYVDTALIGQVLDGNSALNVDLLPVINQLCTLPPEIVQFVTSPKALEEILAFDGTDEATLAKIVPLRLIYALMGRVSESRYIERNPHVAKWGQAKWGMMKFGAGPTRDRGELRALGSHFRDRADAQHILTAHENGCAYFVTLDEKTILRPYRDAREAIDLLIPGTTLCNPAELLDDLELAFEVRP